MLKVPEDFDGISVPQGNAPDLGAYEYTNKSTGLEERNDLPALSAYPNPFSGEITINYTADEPGHF